MKSWIRIGWIVAVAAWLPIGPPSTVASAQLLDEEVAEHEKWEKFLESAEIVSSTRMGEAEGVTQPHRLTMRLAGVERFGLWKNPSGLMGGFWEGGR